MTPLELAADVCARFERLGIAYAIGGSVAAALVGEPRSTADIDIAVALNVEGLPALLDVVREDFYVSEDAAEQATAARRSFNLIDQRSALKVDLFVLGDHLLDRSQIARRIRVELPVDPPIEVWVTSPEDVVLRKLSWFAASDGVSDRQWRDIVGVLRLQAGLLDDRYLDETAVSAGLSEHLADARRAATD